MRKWRSSVERKAHLALSEYVLRSLSFALRFDLIYAFSVFAHLSKKTAHVVLSALRDHIGDIGVLVLTIRPKEYWHLHGSGTVAAVVIETHDETEFAFVPHNRLPIDGDITCGYAHIPWLLRRAFPAVEVYASRLQPYR